jgi:hypothetical protein
MGCPSFREWHPESSTRARAPLLFPANLGHHPGHCIERFRLIGGPQRRGEPCEVVEPIDDVARLLMTPEEHASRFEKQSADGTLSSIFGSGTRKRTRLGTLTVFDMLSVLEQRKPASNICGLRIIRIETRQCFQHFFCPC